MNWSFKKMNNLGGWLCFALSFIVYALTVEPNASYWDCGEYIAVSANLGVGHAPGAAFFQLLNATLSIFSGSKANIPWLVNMVSALSSAFTILFLFWTITHIAYKFIIEKNKVLTKTQSIVILGSGFTGALTFAFSDSFWFSAVEGEVYAMSSLVSALLFWMILKWENDDSPRADRWILLISLTIGIAIGIHLMAILVIPAIGLIYYYKKYPNFTWKNFIIAHIVIGIVFLFVFKILFSSTMIFFGWLERIAVNNLGMAFNAGSILAMILIIVAIVGLIILSIQKSWYYINKIILSIAFMLIGFSAWLMLPIRANANPPLNLNDPSDAMGMLAFYTRDQYGDWPILSGPSFAAYKYGGQGIEEEYDKKIHYVKDAKEKKYISEVTLKERYKPDYVTPFARMWSQESIDNYETVMGRKLKEGEIPTLSEEIQFFLTYQVGEMYFRYVLWNFVGRQNDIPHEGKITAGNWKSGIGFIDKMLLGDQDKMPRVDRDNKANNTYFFIPFIFVIIGLYFHWNNDWKRFYAILSIFLLTGLGIVLYTNNKIYQPRERDYAFVTSFYALAIWLGLAVAGIFKALKQKQQTTTTAYLITGMIALAPILMATQNYDDHDRSGRYAAYDDASNYLNSTNKDGILFVYGDNDTYPIWSVQEVQEVRRDVKVLNYLLLSSYWHCKNAVRKTFDAAAVPHSIPYDRYDRGQFDDLMVLVDPNIKSMTDKEVAQFLKDQATSNKLDTYINNLKNSFITTYTAHQDELIAKAQELEQAATAGEATEAIEEQFNNLMQGINYLESQIQKLKNINRKTTAILPTNNIKIPVDKQKVLRNKWVSAKYADQLVDTVDFKIPITCSLTDDFEHSYTMPKSDLLLVDMICSNNWERPIYFGSGALTDDSQVAYLRKYLKFNGTTYQFVPIKAPEDAEKDYSGMIDIPDLLKKFNNLKWANLKDKTAYFDEQSRIRSIVAFRLLTSNLAKELIKQDHNQKEAIKVLDKLMKEVPYELYENIFIYEIIDAYLKAGSFDKAINLAQKYQTDLTNDYLFYNGLDDYLLRNTSYESRRNAIEIANLVDTYQQNIKNSSLNAQQKQKITNLIQLLEQKIKPVAQGFINKATKHLATINQHVEAYNIFLKIQDSIDNPDSIPEKYQKIIKDNEEGIKNFQKAIEAANAAIMKEESSADGVRFMNINVIYESVLNYRITQDSTLKNNEFYKKINAMQMLNQLSY